jgi:acyl-CoA synthetase (AMP-forming)/AMP-acid ligase II
MLSTAECRLVLKPSEQKFFTMLPEALMRRDTQEINENCYILFTSGSSGVPKAVQITYKNLLNTIQWGFDQFDWDENDIVGIPTKFSFDISLFDVFTCLFLSRKMYVFKEVSNPAAFQAECNSALVTSIFTTPSLFVMLNRYNLFHKIKLRRIISGGDFFPTKDLLEILDKNPNLKVFNIWGPTETTIINTCHLVTNKDIELLMEKNLVPVGTPSSRMPLLVASPENESDIVELSSGEIGEIIVLGDSVSPGYLNYTNQFELESSFKTYKGLNAYRTGDLGFLDSYNNLFIVGRNKQFIKYQGFRIDPREVEFIADKHSSISKSVVSASVNDKNESFLVMHVAGNNINVTEIKTYLRNNLPKYMIPKYIVELEEIPLSANGKIDRKAIDDLKVLEISTKLEN